MSENSHTSIRNSVIASLIAAAIISIVEPLRNYALSFFSWVWSGFVWVYDVLLASYALPGWVWLIIFLFAFIGMVGVFQAVRPVRNAEHNEYTEDRMYGAIWRWRWVGNSVSNCKVPLDYLPIRSYPFFIANSFLEKLLEEIKEEKMHANSLA